MSAKQPNWAGNALTEFSVTSSELEEATENREKWKEETDIRYWENDGYKVVEISPTADDAKNNSDGSGDHNILHKDPDVVDEFVEEYDNFTREPEQDGDVVVSQGMSVVDALSDKFDGPLESISGKWRKMTYAPENGEHPDRLLAITRNNGEFDMDLLPGGQYDEAIDDEVGHLEVEYANSPEQYQEDHNVRLTSLKDAAVGRGFKTDDQIRNGELLIENETAVNDPVEWEDAEEYIFNLEDVDENGPKVTATWNIDVMYSDGEISENAISYQETSMYTKDFEGLDSVQKYLE